MAGFEVLRVSTGLVTTVLLGLVAVPAWASLPPSGMSGYASAGFFTPSTGMIYGPGEIVQDQFSSIDYNGFHVGDLDESAIAGILPNGPSIFGFASANIDNVASAAQATTSYLYFFEVSGPDSKVTLNLKASAGVLASAIDYYASYDYGHSSLVVQAADPSSPDRGSGYYPKDLFYASLNWDGGNISETGFTPAPYTTRSLGYLITGGGNFTVNSNELYAVSLSTDDLIQSSQFGSEKGDFWVSNGIDPLITIADSNSNIASYSLNFSDGVIQSINPLHLGPPTTAAALPEATTWIYMLVGFGLAGVAIRRSGSKTLLAGSLRKK